MSKIEYKKQQHEYRLGNWLHSARIYPVDGQLNAAGLRQTCQPRTYYRYISRMLAKYHDPFRGIFGSKS